MQPPLGVMPLWRHQEQRWFELGAAISRYAQHSEPIPIPMQLVEEFNDLVEIIHKRSPGYEPEPAQEQAPPNPLENAS